MASAVGNAAPKGVRTWATNPRLPRFGRRLVRRPRTYAAFAGRPTTPETAPRRPAGSLELLLCDDKRFRDPATSSDAYAEAWALNYYFLQTKSETYVKYLAALADQKPLIDVEPAERIKQFKQFFAP